MGLMNYTLEVTPGAALPGDVLRTCVSVIREGGAVDASSAARQLPKAKSVAIVRANGQIVGVGAVKDSRPHYASTIAKKSAFSFDTNMMELGYVARSPSHRRHKLSEKIVEKLIEAVKDAPLFATTSNETMKRILSNAGFVQQGHAWTGRKRNRISLWVKQAETRGAMSVPHNPADTKLAPDFTVADYVKARDAQPPDRDTIADAIRRRFTKWYIEPVATEPTHGFTIMAVSCLMIEALESFKQGWESSEKRSKAAFCLFFDSSEPFKDFRGHAEDFYTHVRCGILHQAETTGGWRIGRKTGPLFDATSRTVNARRFLDSLKIVVNEFCDRLKNADWNSAEWKNVRNKMNAMVRHL